MAESRFNFLKDDFSELYEKCTQSEQAVEYDVAMLRIRQALEYMIHDLGAQNKDLFQGINELESRNVLDWKVSQRFHAIRRLANQAVHENINHLKENVPKCLNDLLFLTLWYGLKKGKNYKLEQFSPSDIASVRNYLVNTGKLPKEAVLATSDENTSVDPLSLVGSFQVPDEEDQEQDILERDVFETEEEYEQRIADMDPIHIGYGILDTRRKDGYTDVHFLIHHVDHNPDIKFSPIVAFYTIGIENEQVIDSELVAHLKVSDGKVCCDYSQVYLRNNDDLIAVYPIYWHKFFYETNAAYNKRIRSMPLLPFGLGMPIRNKYDLPTSKLPVVVNPFQYTAKILKKILPENMTLSIDCNRDIAKKFCSTRQPALFLAKLWNLKTLKKYVIWRNDLGEIFVYLDAHEIKEVFNQGIAYENGDGVEENYPKAAECYQIAAKHGIAEAQTRLSHIEFHIKIDKLTPEELYHKGLDYESGNGVDKDYHKAVACYQIAVKKGSPEAQNALGICYAKGNGVSKNYQKAREYYQSAANQGSKEAQKNLEEIEDIIFHDSIMGLSSEKLYQKGLDYENGDEISKDYHKAVECYQIAAKRGFANAQNALGKCYAKGIGISQDLSKAMEWLQKAASKGNVESQELLFRNDIAGLSPDELYRKGQEYATGDNAIRCYQMAAERGNAEAQNKLGNYYYYGINVERDYQKSMKWFQKAADQGDTEAQNRLGKCYANGTGVNKNLSKAVEWFQKAAEQGDAEAQKNLEEVKDIMFHDGIAGLNSEELYKKGFDYVTGNGVIRDDHKAIECYQLAAERGNVKAQNKLGIYYYYGIRVNSNYQKAVEWFQKAADQGYAKAQNRLGECYANGTGVNKDLPKAAEWFQKAADQGDVDAQKNLEKVKYTIFQEYTIFQDSIAGLNSEELYKKGLDYATGNGVIKDYHKAIECYQIAAKQGVADAQNALAKCHAKGSNIDRNFQKRIGYGYWEYLLGNCYYNGKGVKKDYTKAVEWYRKAAVFEKSKAQNALGICYYDGKGVKQDYQKATEWFMKAANNRNPSAQYHLGNCYYNGKGVEQNYTKAVEWFYESAKQGCTFAQYDLGNCYYDGKGVKQDYQKAVQYFQQVANKGNASAQNSLGICYYSGKGVERNYQIATDLFQKAANQGYAKAQYNLGNCYYDGKGVKQDYQKAEDWYQKAAAQEKNDEVLQKNVEAALERIKKSTQRKKTGCFITTAVCNSLNKSDDCYELTRFRRFRDHWLALQEDGPSLIEEYYTVAPKIVEKINEKANRSDIYRKIWHSYLKPCLALIEEGNYTACKDLYVDMVKNLQKKVNGK